MEVNVMKKMVLVPILIFILGCLVGYRATMNVMAVEVVNPDTVFLTAWGETDIYHIN